MTAAEKKDWGEMKEMIHEIHRGLYGDPKNDSPGLIERQKKDEQAMSDHEKRIICLENQNTEERVAKLEKLNRRFIIGIGGMIPIGGSAAHWWNEIKGFIINLIK
ncbi:MAG: hypothetical protein AAGF85_00690 [Bacteroidota bacterium]